MSEIWGGVGGAVAGLLGIFAAVQIVVRLLSGPVSEIRALLDELTLFFSNEIRGKGSQTDTLRMRHRVSVVSPRAPWPVRRQLRKIDRQVAEFHRPGGSVGRTMWPTPELAIQAVTEGSNEVARARSYLDRLERWTVSK